MTLLNREIFRLSSENIKEQHNLTLKLRGLRSRLKILLATTYEEAVELLDSFPNNIVGLVSDIGFPREGKHDEKAGLRLVEYVRQKDSAMPILMQSAVQKNAERVAALAEQIGDIGFINKNESNLLEKVRKFLLTSLGFGT